MNETHLIRTQLALERAHTVEVTSACAAAHAREGASADDAALAALREACVDYLAYTVSCFERRDARLGELYRGMPPGHPGRHAAETALAAGAGGELLGKLAALNGAAGAAAREAWRETSGYVNRAWDAQRRAVEALLDSNPRVGDWRVIGGVDADSILAERARYARVRETLPAGAALPAAAALRRAACPIPRE